jgi:zinc carboxypeptidase
MTPHTFFKAENSIELHVGFDGATPHSINGIKLTGKNGFTVYPSHREIPGNGAEARGGSPRLTVKIINRANAPESTTVFIDHQDESRSRLPFRDFYYLKHENDVEWKMIPTPLSDKDISVCEIEALPGETILAQSPTYNYEKCLKAIKTLEAHPFVKTGIYGKSEKGLDLPVLKISNPFYNEFPKRKVGVVARNHAYETSGNYCIEGMIDFLLLKEDEIAAYLLSQYDFHFIPMTNADGVKFGMNRLTSPDGADMNRVNTVKDAAHSALKALLEKEKYDVFVNLHNWQNKSIDGILCNDSRFGELFCSFLPTDTEHYKIWSVHTPEKWAKSQGFDSRDELIAAKPEVWKKGMSWKNYVQELNSDANAVTLEFPWYGRNSSAMRKWGEKNLKATIHTDIHLRLEKQNNLK